MREQKRVDAQDLGEPAKRFWQMAVDKDRVAIDAVACDVGYIVGAAYDAVASPDRLHRIQHHRVFDVFRFMPDFLLKTSCLVGPRNRIPTSQRDGWSVGSGTRFFRQERAIATPRGCAGSPGPQRPVFGRDRRCRKPGEFR